MRSERAIIGNLNSWKGILRRTLANKMMKTFSSEYHDYTNCASCQNASWKLSEQSKEGMKPDPLYQNENKLRVNLGTRSLLNH
jgi:hypothetical protein